MDNQYPYQLSVHSFEDYTRDADGNVIVGSDYWIDVSKCRDETGNGKVIQLSDGQAHIYTSVIHCPLDCPDLASGNSIRVMDGAKLRFQNTVKLFNRGLFHCRIWV